MSIIEPIEKTKICPHCGLRKSIKFGFYLRSGKRAGQPRGWCKECELIRTVEYQKANPEKVAETQHRWDLKRRYGITLEEKHEMLKQQDYRCANPGCRTTEPGGKRNKEFHLDHNHKTGRKRALLCADCNRALGCVQDDENKLFGLIKYLRLHRLIASVVKEGPSGADRHTVFVDTTSGH